MTATVALAAAWVLRVALPEAPFPPYSVGQWIVTHTPGGVATAAIDHLGHHALPLLEAATVVGALTLGAALGRCRSLTLGSAAAAASFVAVRLDPRHPPAGASLLAVACVGVTAWLAATAWGPQPAATDTHATASTTSRRRVLAAGGLGLGWVVLGAGVVQRAGHRVARRVVRADRPALTAVDPTFVAPAGLSPAVSTAAEHYVVAIDLDPPVVDHTSWRLHVRGAVHHPLALTLDELRSMPTVERLVTLTCISNPVGGALVGNSRWTGVPVADLLRRVEPHPDGRFVRAQSLDGYQEWLSLDEIHQGPVLIAFGMDGALLPAVHGFPARLVAPGHYGMKHVKWLHDLVVVTTTPSGYWGERGWDSSAVVRTQSRIDVPAGHAHVARSFTAAGIAWAGIRRIARVEISVDDHPDWMPVRLEREGDPLAWRRWRVDLDLPAGVHTLTVRAVDGSGQTQDAAARTPHPTGASGYHRIVVTVR